MAETMLELKDLSRAEAWVRIEAQLEALLDGIDDEIAAMATICCVVHHCFGHLWTGFYRRVGDRLLVGPYQGTLGCLEIALGRGGCGTAAAERRTLVVPDVGAFAGHITCDSRALSELVVPVLDGAGRLIAVFDCDSDRRAAFDEADGQAMGRILGWFGRRHVLQNRA